MAGAALGVAEADRRMQPPCSGLTGAASGVAPAAARIATRSVQLMHGL